MLKNSAGRLVRPLLAWAFLTLQIAPAWAANFLPASGDYNVAGNWNTAAVPSGAEALIGTSGNPNVIANLGTTASANPSNLKIGSTGNGTLNINAGGLLTVTSDVQLGENGSAVGTLNIAAGGVLSQGVTARIGTNGQQQNITIDPTGRWNLTGANREFRLHSGTFNNLDFSNAPTDGKISFLASTGFVIGSNNNGVSPPNAPGAAVLTLDTGSSANLAIRTMSIGNDASLSNGTLNLTGITITTSQEVIIGGNGRGTLNITGGTLNTTGPVRLRTSVGTGGVGAGTIFGNGLIAPTGNFVMNGRAVASGGDLRFTWGALENNEFAILQGDGTQAGWYAVNGGKIDLAPLTINNTSPISWGETGADTTPDLVNSVRLSGGSFGSFGTLDISLLASDHGSALPGLIGVVGLWDFAAGGGLSVNSVTLMFRYDDLAAGAGEANLKLFHNSGSGWTEVSGFTIDTTANTITGTVNSFSQFAVATSAVPEPSAYAIALVGLVGLGVFISKQRRKVRA